MPTDMVSYGGSDGTMMTRMANLTAAEFGAAVADHAGLLLVDFWAPGCAPCRTLSPVLDDLASDFAGEVRFCKVDVDAEPALRERLGVRGVPTLALFRDTQELDRIQGTRTRSQLTAWLEGYL